MGRLYFSCRLSTDPGILHRRGFRRLVLLLLIAGFVGAHWLRVESGFEFTTDELRSRFTALGTIAPLFYILALTLRPLLLIPSPVLFVVGGLLFGTVGGVLWGTLGGTLSALLVYTVARVLGREAIERRLRGSLAKADAYLERRGMLWLIGATALPVTPFNLIHCAMGLSGIGPIPFLLGTSLGLVPRCALFSFFGASLLEGGSRIILASALVVIVLLAAWALHRTLMKAPPASREG